MSWRWWGIRRQSIYRQDISWDRFKRKRPVTYVDDGLLALDASLDLLLLQLDDEVTALQVAGNRRYHDVELRYCLGPFVGQSSLLGGFFCAGCCLLLGREI